MQNNNWILIRDPETGRTREAFGIIPRCTLTWVLAVFSLSACLIVSEWLSEEKVFIFLTLFVVVFMAIGAALVYRERRSGLLLDPFVLSSLLTFSIGFGISNHVLLSEIDRIDYYIGTDAYQYLNKAMLLASFAMFSLWAGYRSEIGLWLNGKWTHSGIAKRIFRKEYRPNYRLIVAFMVLSLFCRLLQVRLGVFGYSAEIERLNQLASYTQWLTIGANLGFLALLVVSLTWFHGSTDRRALYFMVTLLVYETIFGFLSGFKSAVVMPLVLTGIAYYYAKDRFPWKAFFTGIILLSLAYAVIEPFRALRYRDPDFKNRDIVAIAYGVVTAGEDYERQQVEDVFRTQISLRMNSTLMAACAVKYMDENKLPPNAPAFLQDLFLAPFHALVPRFLWPTKPIANIGMWFNSEVLGAPEDSPTSSGMTPIGYLYFSGGALAIGIGFFLIGIAQRWVAVSFWKGGSGSAIVYFGLLGNLVVIESSVNAIFVSLIRNLLLLVSVQYFLFKK